MTTERLSCSNFLSYIYRPWSTKLDSKDHNKATVIFLVSLVGTLGILPLSCYILPKLKRVICSILCKKTQQVAQPILNPSKANSNDLSNIQRNKLNSIFDNIITNNGKGLPSTHKLRQFFFDHTFKHHFDQTYQPNDMDFDIETYNLLNLQTDNIRDKLIIELEKKYPNAFKVLKADPDTSNPFHRDDQKHRLANNNIGALFKICAKQNDSTIRSNIYDMLKELLANEIIRQAKV